MVLGTRIVLAAVGSVLLTAAAGLLMERSAAAAKVDQLVGRKIDEIAIQTNILALNKAGTARAGAASVSASTLVSDQTPEPSTIAILTVGATCCGMWLRSRVLRGTK
jgi:hypothetical protein